MKLYDQCMLVIIKNKCIGLEYLPRVIQKDVEKMRNYKNIWLQLWRSANEFWNKSSRLSVTFEEIESKGFSWRCIKYKHDKRMIETLQ